MYSISTNFFPDHKDAMVGYIEAVTGVGLIMGPLLGSFLYALGGYQFIFWVFGGIFIVFSFFIKCIFNSEIDGKPTNLSGTPLVTISAHNSTGDNFQRVEL